MCAADMDCGQLAGGASRFGGVFPGRLANKAMLNRHNGRIRTSFVTTRILADWARPGAKRTESEFVTFHV